MPTKDRLRLIWSIVSAEGVWRTVIERVKWASPSPSTPDSNSPTRIPGLPYYNDYCGAAHIHSTYSDGTGTIPDIAEAGGYAGLDFILFADHNTIDARRDGLETWQARNRVLVVIGSEVTTSEGHLLAFDTPLSFFPAPFDSVECMKAIQACGGYGFIALPCDWKGHWGDYSLREPGIGIEAFNLSTIARTKINVPGFLMALVRYRGKMPMSAYELIAGRPATELQLWDKMLAESASRCEPLPQIIGSLDAHAVMRIAGREFPYPTYEEAFRTLRTHIVTSEQLSYSLGDVEDDIKIVHDAMRRGHSYVSFDNFGDPQGFMVELRKNGEFMGTTGETYELDADAATRGYSLAVRAPLTRTIIHLYRDGKLVLAQRGGIVEYPITQPGIYRAEVYLFKQRLGDLCLGTVPWIFSNALQVKFKESAMAGEQG